MRGLGGDDRLCGRAGDDALFGDAGRDVLAGEDGHRRDDRRRAAPTGSCSAAWSTPRPTARSTTRSSISRAPSTTRSTCARSTPYAGSDGNQAFRFIGDDAFTRAGQLRFEATADGDFLVSGNVDRDLDADFAFVVRTDLASLKASDFLL